MYRGLIRGIAYGCTMVFDKDLRDIINSRSPKKIDHPHDLWVFKIAMLLGYVCFDMNSYILYRQHSGNVVGANNTFLKRLKSMVRSIFVLSKQHYRENSAKELLLYYSDLLTIKQINALKIVAYYRGSCVNRIRFFLSNKFVCEKI